MKKKPKRRKRPQAVDEQSLEIQARQDFGNRLFLSGLKKLDQIITAGKATPEVWKQVGIGLNELEEFAQAKDALEKALEYLPSDPVVRFAMAQACYELGDCDQAVAEFQSVIEANNDIRAWCNLATIAPGAPSESNQSIFHFRSEYARLAIEETKIVSTDKTQSEVDTPTQTEVSTEKIRVGFVSAYFHRENYMKPVWSLIRGRNRARIECHLFSDKAEAHELDWFEATDGDQIHDTTALSNEEMAELIRQQSLDVLVDLNAYSVPSRLPIYFRRIAKVMVAWFNMYATSGITMMDWIIGDRWVIPECEEQYYSENVYRLPTSYLSFDVEYPAPDVVAPPCSSKEVFTFGSLISQYKITPQVIETWAEILRQTEKTRLLIGNRAVGSKPNQEYVLERFAKLGVDNERVEFLSPAPHREFLTYYNQMDIALDAFPYNGGTTTTEAIWQGVPVIALDGDRWASRTSKTLLCNCHLEEFVAADLNQYIKLAVDWATRADRVSQLQELRTTMRERLRISPVCDKQRFANDFEQAMREILRSNRK